VILPHKDFCLIRHGQTEANRDGRVAGRTEAQLTSEGRAAAVALTKLDWPAGIVLFTSPQDRARDTARLAFPGHVATVVEDLRERNWGFYEGRSVADLPPRTETPTDGEAWADVLARSARALHLCLMQADEAMPVIIAHSGIIRAARALTGGDFDGPSAANAAPLLFAHRSGHWQERSLCASDTP
jgi:probable phosphoglycerate mutase